MGKLENLLTGTKILEEVDSPINGKLTVVRDIGWGTYIKAGGLTQSGGVVFKVWKSVLWKIFNNKREINKSLILGLGGGDAARIIRKYWPEAEITGVDIDQIMVDLGRKYLELDKARIKVEIQDAYQFLISCASSYPNHYDLVLVDTYIGDNYPKKFEQEEFLSAVRKVLTTDGVAVFNRLFFGKKRKNAMDFGESLEKVFPKVSNVFPEANIMFICLKT